MAATLPAVRPIHCDGCTLEATAEHLRRRIARLEWASRFRPIHISTLFLTLAPPASLEDHFYYPETTPREPAARALFEDLIAACDCTAAGVNREPALRQFQHGGFFLAEAIECPIEPGPQAEGDALLARLLPAIVRRVRFSYRPKAMVLLSEPLRSVTQALRSGVESQLLLCEGSPVAHGAPDDVAVRQRFREQVRGLLRNPASA